MIVEMKKLVLVGHRGDRFNLFKTLHKCKIVEIVSTKNLDNTTRLNNAANIDKINVKLGRLGFAIQYIVEQNRIAARYAKKTKKDEEPYEYNPVKKKPFGEPIQRIDFDNFEEIIIKEVELFAHVSDLEDYSARTNEFNSRKLKLQSEIEQLSVYKAVEIPFADFKDTAKTSVALGYVPTQRKDELAAFVKETEDIVFEAYEGADEGKFFPFSVVCLKERSEEIFAKLQELEFTKTGFNGAYTAVQGIENAEKEINEIENEKIELMTRALEKEVFVPDFKMLYDFYMVELQKFNALDGFAATKRSFVLEAWCPAEQEEYLKGLLDATSDAFVYEFRAPDEGEVVPTLVRSSKIIAPYEDVTNMYSVPNYREDIDPNPIMAFFYFLFFGMMIADAGYGLLIAVGAFCLYKWRKPVPGKGKLILIIGIGGMSTVIWGALFGGWFGLEIGGTFFDKLKWFNPMDEPLMMLILSLALGVVQLMTGMILSAIVKIKHKRVSEAIFTDISWIAAIIGLGLAVVGMMVVKNNALTYTGVALLAVALVMIVGGNARGKQGVGGKIKGFFGGFGKLYNAVNLLSDVLSYARLFGLGLAGGVIGMVINIVCQTVIGMIPYLGYVIAIVIFGVGHLFNIAISTLGAYVHNCRLQYMEFYGKFYTGSGHQFIPFGSKTKYTYIEMQEVAK